MTPPLNENKRNLRFANGGVVGEVLGGSGRFGGRGNPLSRGFPLPSRSFPCLQGLPHPSLHLLRESLYLRGALGIQSRADANNRVGKGQILAGF